jgi:agarase
MGVFVDNELSWGATDTDKHHYNVAIGALTAPSTQPAKAWWVSQLNTKYNGSISALNTAWGSHFTSFSSLQSNTSWKPTTYPSGMATDFKNFVHAFAGKYYGAIKSALTSAGVKALYLGSRFSDYNPEVVTGADDSVDVLSFNIYRFADNVDWTYLNSLSKPVLISEFTYAEEDAGTFGGLAEVSSQPDRISAMNTYLNSALSCSNIVGVEWYRYADQPITGRWSDFENGGNGIVDVSDTPYQPTVDTFRGFTANLYTSREGASRPAGP